MRTLTYKEFKEKCKEVFLLISESNIKYTNDAYGYSNDTLLMYPEENAKYMFYMCKAKNGSLCMSRPHVYVIKPYSFTEEFGFRHLYGKIIEGSHSQNTPRIKIPLNNKRVKVYKNIHESQQKFRDSVNELVKKKTDKHIEKINLIEEGMGIVNDELCKLIKQLENEI